MRARTSRLPKSEAFGEDDYLETDLMFREMAFAAMQTDGLDPLFDALHESNYDLADEQLDYVLGLYSAFEAKLPK